MGSIVPDPAAHPLRRSSAAARARVGSDPPCYWLADEISGWHLAGINSIVSLLEVHVIRELGLKEEPALCRGVGIEFTPKRRLTVGVGSTDRRKWHATTEALY